MSCERALCIPLEMCRATAILLVSSYLHTTADKWNSHTIGPKRLVGSRHCVMVLNIMRPRWGETLLSRWREESVPPCQFSPFSRQHQKRREYQIDRMIWTKKCLMSNCLWISIEVFKILWAEKMRTLLLHLKITCVKLIQNQRVSSTTLHWF